MGRFDVFPIFIANFVLTKSVIWKSKFEKYDEVSKLANRNPLESKIKVNYYISECNLMRKSFEVEDYVRLVPYSYHNYMGYQEEGSVYELPWEYECSEDGGSSLTAEQYKEIVSFAEWQEEERVKVN